MSTELNPQGATPPIPGQTQGQPAPAATPSTGGNTPPAQPSAPAGNEPPAGGTPPAQPSGNTGQLMDGGAQGGKPAEPGQQQPAPKAGAGFPDDWRVQLAGDDKKIAGMLERISSPQDLVKKLREQDATITRLSSQKGALPKDATPEMVAEYRKANGIPETPAQYDLTLKDGLTVGEEDKAIVGNMLNVMHSKNMSNEDVKEILSSYYAQEKAFLSEQETRIKQNNTDQKNQLTQDWGSEYDTNLNLAKVHLDVDAAGIRDIVMGGFDHNGMPLRNNAAFTKYLAHIGRMIHPPGSVPSADGTSQMASVADEMKQIEALMGDHNSEYWKGPKVDGKDTAKAIRYRELLNFQENAKRLGRA